jgi:hypothetical protein
MKISPSLDRQVNERVTRECFEHVIEESNARLHPTLPTAIEIDANVKISLLGGSGDLAYSWHRIS